MAWRATWQRIVQWQFTIGVSTDTRHQQSRKHPHVCPQWFAPRFQLDDLVKGQEPQLRTVTNTQIQVYGHKYVVMRNNRKQSIVIPFYVCDVHVPMLPVTGLAEQGFNIQRNEGPTMTHRHGFDAQLIQKEGLYVMRTEMIHLPANCTLTVKDTEAGQFDSDPYTNRCRATSRRRQRRLLVLEHTRISGETPQAKQEVAV